MITRCYLTEQSLLVGKEFIKPDGEGLMKVQRSDSVTAPDEVEYEVYLDGEVDLPTDGTYLWNPDLECFVPVAKKRPDFYAACFAMMERVVSQDNPPEEVVMFVEYARKRLTSISERSLRNLADEVD